MSGYDKLQSRLSEFNSTRVLQEQSFAPYSQPPYLAQQGLASYTTGSSPESLTFSPASASFGTQASYVFLQPLASIPQHQQLPEILSYSPTRGPQGSSLTVYLRLVYNLLSTPSASCALMFASRQCEGLIEPLESRTDFFDFALTTEVPPLNTTEWPSSKVPLRLVVMNAGVSHASQTVNVGTYTYLEELPKDAPSSPLSLNRKRKLLEGTENAMCAPTKRPLVQNEDEVQLQSQVNGAGDRSYAPPAYSYLPTASAGVASYGIVSSKAPNIPAYQAQTNQSHFLCQNGLASPAKLSSPQTPSFASSFSSVNKPTYSPRGQAVIRANVGSPPGFANPPLIRTSTLQSGGAAGTPTGNFAGGPSFNPYAMYPHKAVLKINGNLDSMAENWSETELLAKRRLVQFARRQNGSVIHTDFKPVDPGERSPNSICISCIWWEEKRECFVTSVDTIYLLESLVAVRFTVEEKNRIRRNLEGFRPMTVSKAKQESEEFFKVIMAFPTPKPRNIEKDVKVFPWRILAVALKKIIGKYSASYSSTAGALLTPVGSVYFGNDQSMTTHDIHAASPASAASSTGISPHMSALPMQQSPLNTLSAPVDPRVGVSMPSLMPPYPTTPSSFPYPGMPSSLLPRPVVNQQPPQLMPQPTTTRPSWGYNTFVHVNTVPACGTDMPMSAAPNALPNLNLNATRNPNESVTQAIDYMHGTRNSIPETTTTTSPTQTPATTFSQTGQDFVPVSLPAYPMSNPSSDP